MGLRELEWRLGELGYRRLSIKLNHALFLFRDEGKEKGKDKGVSVMHFVLSYEGCLFRFLLLYQLNVLSSCYYYLLFLFWFSFPQVLSFFFSLFLILWIFVVALALFFLFLIFFSFSHWFCFSPLRSSYSYDFCIVVLALFFLLTVLTLVMSFLLSLLVVAFLRVPVVTSWNCFPCSVLSGTVHFLALWYLLALSSLLFITLHYHSRSSLPSGRILALVTS